MILLTIQARKSHTLWFSSRVMISFKNLANQTGFTFIPAPPLAAAPGIPLPSGPLACMGRERVTITNPHGQAGQPQEKVIFSM